MDLATTMRIAVVVAILVTAIVAYHPAISRIGCAVAVGAAIYAAAESLVPPAVIAIALAAVLLLALGPCRVSFFELDDVRRRPSSHARLWGVGVATVVVGALTVWAAWPLLDRELPDGRVTAGAVLLIVSFACICTLLGWFWVQRALDYLLAPVRTRPREHHTGQLRDCYVVRSGYGRAARLHHCVEFDGDATVWRVSWWRLRYLVRHSDAQFDYEIGAVTGGLRFTRGFRRSAAPAPDEPPDAVRVRPLTSPIVRIVGTAVAVFTVIAALTAIGIATSVDPRLAMGATIVVVMAGAIVAGSILRGPRRTRASDPTALRTVPVESLRTLT